MKSTFVACVLVSVVCAIGQAHLYSGVEDKWRKLDTEAIYGPELFISDNNNDVAVGAYQIFSQGLNNVREPSGGVYLYYFNNYNDLTGPRFIQHIDCESLAGLYTINTTKPSVKYMIVVYRAGAVFYTDIYKYDSSANPLEPFSIIEKRALGNPDEAPRVEGGYIYNRLAWSSDPGGGLLGRYEIINDKLVKVDTLRK
jgi:hypothetical protein